MIQHLENNNGTVAYQHQDGSTPGVVFCGGFRSDMSGNKARYLDDYCQRQGWQYTRFDYRGHGQSSDDFTNCGIDTWLEDTLAILDHVTVGKQIIIGSSMGLWLALLATIRRPQRIAGLLGIAGAPDFTEVLIREQLDEPTRQTLKSGGTWFRPSQYDDQSPYPITGGLLDSGRQLLLLNDVINIDCPVRLIHGTGDTDVPWSLSLQVLDAIRHDDVALTLLKDSDHRLSTPDELACIARQLSDLHHRAEASAAN